MNNETKQLFKNQLAIMNTVNHIMVHTCSKDSGDFQKHLIECYVETEELLDPKEVVPYEDSLDVCKNCGKVEEKHAGFEKRCSLKSKEVFVSSKLKERGS